MGREITDVEQLETLVVGETIPFYISNSESPDGLRLDYSYCWRDQHSGKEIMIFARGGDSTHILAYITQKDWFKVVDEFGLVMSPPKLPLGRSFGQSFTPDDRREFGVLYRALGGKNPTEEEMELFRKGILYKSFFGEE